MSVSKQDRCRHTGTGAVNSAEEREFDGSTVTCGVACTGVVCPPPSSVALTAPLSIYTPERTEKQPNTRAFVMDSSNDIIEVSSSPELPPQNLPSVSKRRLGPPKQPAAAPTMARNTREDMDVIVISDTDDEAVNREDVPAYKGKGKGKENATTQVGGARNGNARQPAAGPSRRAQTFAYAALLEDDGVQVEGDENTDPFAEGPLVNLPTQLGSSSRSHPRPNAQSSSSGSCENRAAEVRVS
jgi:hypothetical protein